MKYLFLFLLFFAITESNGQKYFEGEIIYSIHIQKKDPSFDISNIISHPAKTFTFLFKNGIWINAPDSGMIDYAYFRTDENRNYYKWVGVDKLYYYDYAQLPPDQDTLVSVETQYNSDTILGLICNRLILKTNKLTLTLVYSPLLAVNPVWFARTKGGYYDVIYKHTKSLYLMSIVETAQYVSKDIAVEINERALPNEIFEDIHRLPKRPIAIE